MLRVFTCFLIMCFVKLGYAQNCDCEKSIRFLETEIENNSASYQDQVVQAGKLKEYNDHVEMINKQARLIKDQKNCIGLCSKYLSFIKDAHLSVNYDESYFPFKSFADSAQVKAYFESLPRLAVAKQESKSSVEGIWYFEDGSYSIRIFRNGDANRDFVGIINETSQPYWKPGHIKLELKAINDSTFESIYWRLQLKPSASVAHLKKNQLTVGRLVFYANPKLNKAFGFTLTDKPEFKILSSKTCYLRIPSFDLQYSNKIDSLIKTNLQSILGKRNLIIDLRGNGGGGDNAYYPLLSLVLDKKQVTFPMRPSVWISPANLEWYDKTKYEGAESKKDSMVAITEIDSFKKYLNQFTHSKFAIDTLDTLYNGTEKIAIIANGGCASSTEGFILLSRQSKKVTLYGENTFGAISYGDWRRINIDGLPIWISNTTKKMNLINNMQIESIGIKPDKSLVQYYYSDWLEKVQKDIEQE